MYSSQYRKYLALFTEQHFLLHVGINPVSGEISTIIRAKRGDVV